MTSMKFVKSVQHLFLGLLVLISSGCVKDEPIILQTKKLTLEYSLGLEIELGMMGLIDITKLEPKEEIEALNLKYVRIPSNLYEGQIIILDANGNNSFVDSSIDFFGLTNMKGKATFKTINFIKYKHPIIVRISNELFSIKIENDGNGMELTKVNESNAKYDLTYPFKLPEIEVNGLNEDVNLNKRDGKYTYIEFWGTWCKPCIQLIPELKSLNKYYSDKLNLISINYHDKDINNVREFVRIKKMNWEHIVADSVLMKEFGSPSFYPCGVLFNPDGYLVKYGILPNEVKEYLKKK